MSVNPDILPFIHPVTGEQFGQVSMATEEDITRAYMEMRQNFAIWRRKSVKERVRILRKFQSLIIDSVDIISQTINMGCLQGGGTVAGDVAIAEVVGHDDDDVGFFGGLGPAP